MKSDHEISSRHNGTNVSAYDYNDASTSQDLNAMVPLMYSPASPLDRHFLLQNIITEAFKLRETPKYRSICKEAADIHYEQFPNFIAPIKNFFDGELPHIVAFQTYAMILTEEGDYQKAIAVCEKAIAYKLHDNTQSGFEGRIARIKKEMEKAI